MDALHAVLVPIRHFGVKKNRANSVQDIWYVWGYCTAMVTQIYGWRSGHLFIAEWMEEKEVSDEQLAGRLDPPVARETVTRWRNQQHRLNPAKIAAIAAALDIRPQQLWRPPPPDTRPSIDEMLEDASDELVRQAAEMTAILRRTGS